MTRTERKMISALHGHSGKGDHARSCYTEGYRAGYDLINWHKTFQQPLCTTPQKTRKTTEKK